MKYGFFDEANREYVITRPDTPAPWANYLGSPEYGALISNNAGGYSFVKSGAHGRLLRYNFDERDRPGRYIYIRDNSDGDYWSASWQPVGKDLKEYTSECRHGLGYTRICADYHEIHSEALWYVPQDADWEVWHLALTNRSDRERSLTVTGYAEFTNDGNYEQDTVNLQYSRFITRTLFRGNRICQQINGNLDVQEKESAIDNKLVTERFFGLSGRPVDSWCGDRDLFLGSYHDYRDPEGVASGSLCNEGNYNGYGCGALSSTLVLAPGQTVCLTFSLGMKRDPEAEQIIKRYENPDQIQQEMDVLHDTWEEKLSGFRVKTPCPEFDTMINTWNAYN